MNTLKLTSQFKKDLKRYKHQPEVIDNLEDMPHPKFGVIRGREATGQSRPLTGQGASA